MPKGTTPGGGNSLARNGKWKYSKKASPSNGWLSLMIKIRRILRVIGMLPICDA
jgi:hypothetical protein